MESGCITRLKHDNFTMALKLAICGTHSTGKTTLLQSLQSVLRGGGYSVTTVGDLAVEARSHGFPILRDHTFESTLWIMTRGITLELEAELNADIVLVDRPVPDAMGYLLAALKHRGVCLPSSQLDYLRLLAQQHAATYHRIFKTSIDPTKPIDGAKQRDMDFSFRAQVALELERVFMDLGILFDSLDVDPDKAKAQILRQAKSLLAKERT
jgi:predicted ATPase